jgi:hypothetical protein
MLETDLLFSVHHFASMLKKVPSWYFLPYDDTVMLELKHQFKTYARIFKHFNVIMFNRLVLGRYMEK